MDESANEIKPAKTDLPKSDGLGAAGAEKPKVKMTAEEQMAAFEKAMKEEDWGHQPC